MPCCFLHQLNLRERAARLRTTPMHCWRGHTLVPHSEQKKRLVGGTNACTTSTQAHALAQHSTGRGAGAQRCSGRQPNWPSDQGTCAPPADAKLAGHHQSTLQETGARSRREARIQKTGASRIKPRGETWLRSHWGPVYQ